MSDLVVEMSALKEVNPLPIRCIKFNVYKNSKILSHAKDILYDFKGDVRLFVVMNLLRSTTFLTLQCRTLKIKIKDLS